MRSNITSRGSRWENEFFFLVWYFPKERNEPVMPISYPVTPGSKIFTIAIAHLENSHIPPHHSNSPILSVIKSTISDREILIRKSVNGRLTANQCQRVVLTSTEYTGIAYYRASRDTLRTFALSCSDIQKKKLTRPHKTLLYLWLQGHSFHGEAKWHNSPNFAH